MNVGKVLKEAWAAVEEADLPDDLRSTAFQEAVRLLTPSAVTPASAPSAAPNPIDTRRAEPLGSSPNDGGTGPTEEQIYARVVAQTGVDRDKLERVVHLDGDAIRVSLPGLKLGKTNAERARVVAQLVTVVRGFGYEEGETSLELIRAECERLKVYDSANFSSHMKALNGFVVTGTGQNRKVRAKGPGIQAFPTVVDNLLGEPV